MVTVKVTTPRARITAVIIYTGSIGYIPNCAPGGGGIPDCAPGVPNCTPSAHLATTHAPGGIQLGLIFFSCSSQFKLNFWQYPLKLDP